jgi:hypothetical protein
VISFRYVPTLCALLGLALIPTIIHSYGGGTVEDGRSAAAIPTILDGYTSTPTDRASNWGKRRFDSDDWVERSYIEAGSDPITLTVVRSFDPKRLYHHPELAIAYRRTSFVGEEIRRFAERTDIPVHVLQPEAGTAATGIGMYVLHYGSGFIEDPIWFQVRSAGELFFSRRLPMTLFFVLDSSTTPDSNQETPRSTRLLFAAIDAFVR